LTNAYFKFDRIILCGSILPENFDWSRVENQIIPENKRDAIINECGIKDMWPALARSTSWGYGASGTYGFGSYNVRDRFHPIGHSGYFDKEFVQKYWVSAAAGNPIDFSETDSTGAGTPSWFGIFGFPLRWIIVVGVPVVLALAVLPTLKAVGLCIMPGTVKWEDTCIDARYLKSREELSARVSNLLIDISKMLDLKDRGRDSLFALMDAFLANPSDETWSKVQAAATTLRGHVKKSVDDIRNYDAYLRKSEKTGKVRLITDGDKTLTSTTAISTPSLRYWTGSWVVIQFLKKC